MTAIEKEIEAKVNDAEVLESELETLQAEWDKEDGAEENVKVIKMICSGACEKCGNCESAKIQEIDEDDEEIIDILKTPCDCEILGIEVKHVVRA